MSKHKQHLGWPLAKIGEDRAHKVFSHHVILQFVHAKDSFK